MIIAASFAITAVALWMQNSAVHIPVEKEEKIKDPVISRKSVPIGFALGVVAVLHALGLVVLGSFDWAFKVKTTLISVSTSSKTS